MKTTGVLVVTHTGELGGAELALVRLLRALNPAQWEITVMTLSDGPLVEMLRDQGTPVEVRSSDSLTDANRAKAGRLLSALSFASPTLRAAREVRSVAREYSAQLVVANSLKSAMIVMLARGGSRRPWVWHLHDRLARDYMPRAAVILMRIVARLAPVVVANSRATLSTLPRSTQRRATLAYPGVETAEFNHPRQAPDASMVGMVGRVSATKGQLEFLEAAARLVTRHPRVRFRVVGEAKFGDREYDRRVDLAIERLGLDERVDRVGWTDDPAGAIAGLTVFVHASPVPEPFGQVVAEALALQVPVVATDAGGVPELLDPDGTGIEVTPGVRVGKYGILVRPADVDALANGIELVLANLDDARDRSERAVDYVRDRLSISRTARQVALAWEQVL